MGKKEVTDAFLKVFMEEPSNRNRFAPGAEAEVESHGRRSAGWLNYLLVAMLACLQLAELSPWGYK